MSAPSNPRREIGNVVSGLWQRTSQQLRGAQRRLKVGRTLALALSLTGLQVGPPSGIPERVAAPLAQDLAVTAPKWLEAPLMDGSCDDAAYAHAGVATLRSGQGGSTGFILAMLVHSGEDLFVCFPELPTGAGWTVSLRVDSSHTRSEAFSFGDYEFTADDTGAIGARRADMQGIVAPLIVPQGDIVASVRTNRSGQSNAELRVNLEWLGGFGRIDGAQLTFEPRSGPMLTWPAAARAERPASWGELRLGPMYSPDVQAGSLFVDGRRGFLVVPESPDLFPPEMTIEAWVRVERDTCGMLFGSQRVTSAWIGFCQGVRFGSGESSQNRAFHQALGDGWHHIAVVTERAGEQQLYIDGLLEQHPGWQPGQELPTGPEVADERGQSQSSGVMLRIGSDGAIAPDADRLHAFVRQLRVWGRVREAREISADAFRELTGHEDGLIAVWPFTHGLEDLTGRHHAGIVGDAALARESLDVTAFPHPPSLTAPAYAYPGPLPAVAWDGRIFSSMARFRLDGVCGRDEYGEAGGLQLESSQLVSMQVALGSDAFYLCTNPLLGQLDSSDGVVLIIGNSSPGPVGLAPLSPALLVRIESGGSLFAATWNGREFGGPAPEGIIAKTIGGEKFAPQEDVRAVGARWWSTELRIPFAALAPFQPGDPLLLSVQYTGTIASAGVSGRGSNAVDSPPSQNATLQASWPATFDMADPRSWGPATTSATPDPNATNRPEEKPELPVPPVGGGRLSAAVSSDTSSEPELHTADFKEVLWPRPQPPVGDYYAHCPTPDLDDPKTLIKQLGYIRNPSVKWPLVDPPRESHSGTPVIQVQGTLHDINVSSVDFPWIHNSHDVDMVLSPDSASRWAVLNSIKVTEGGVEKFLPDPAGYSTDDLVLETESLGLPPSDRAGSTQARPNVGDHVTAVGSWIYDCGHNPKTEIHPVPILESDRIEYRPQFAGSPLIPVRVVRVWMNSDPGGEFSYSLNRPFAFQVPLDSKLLTRPLAFFKVVSSPAGGGVANPTFAGPTATITVTPPATKGRFYWEFLFGTLNNYNASMGTRGAYTVTLDCLDAVNDHGGTVLGVKVENGHWVMAANVNGSWRQLFYGNDIESSGTDCGDYPLNIAVPVSVNPNVGYYAEPGPGDDRLRIQITGYADHMTADTTIGVLAVVGGFVLGPAIGAIGAGAATLVPGVGPVAGGAVATGGVVAGPAAAALVASGLTGYADDELTSGTWDLGPIGSRTIGSQLLCLTSGGLGGTTMKVDPTCSAPGDAKGDWVIRYHVTEGAAIPAVLTDGAYWKPLLDDRNGGFTTPVAKSVSAAGSSSGVLPVPGSTEPALVSTYHGRLLGRPLRHEGITMLTDDWHTFTFDLSDLGKVSYSATPGANVSVVNPFSAADFPGSPDILETLSGPVASKDVLGIRGGVVRVEPAPSGGGDLPYDVNITTNYLPLPPDWGEADDQVSAGWADPPTAGFGRPDVLSRFVTPPGASVTALHDGRPIDLTKAPLASPLPTFAPRRSVTERMAWQHRVSDLDYYNVRVPPVLVRPPGATVCHIEGFGDLGSLGQLFVSGDGIRSILAIAASGSARAFPAEVTTPLGEVMTDGGVGDLTTNLPDGGDVHVIVESHVPGRRGFYRFTASWQDARYYTDEQCRQQIEGLRKAVEWYQTFHGFQITEDQWIRNRLGSGGRPTGTDAPSNPPFVNVLAYTAIGAFEPVWLSTADPVDVIALSPSDESIDEVRLYDATGVLVHSSTPTDVSSAVRAGPAGLVPRARLTATNLDVGFYTLQILSSGQAAGGPVKSIYVGVSQVR